MSEYFYIDGKEGKYLLLATCSVDKSLKLISLSLNSLDLLQPIIHVPGIHSGIILKIILLIIALRTKNLK